MDYPSLTLMISCSQAKTQNWEISLQIHIFHIIILLLNTLFLWPSQFDQKLDPVPRVNSCPRGFCCCVKLDSSYQLSKIAEILWVNSLKKTFLKNILTPMTRKGKLKILHPWNCKKRYISCHSNIKFISFRHHVISPLYI